MSYVQRAPTHGLMSELVIAIFRVKACGQGGRDRAHARPTPWEWSSLQHLVRDELSSALELGVEWADVDFTGHLQANGELILLAPQHNCAQPRGDLGHEHAGTWFDAVSLQIAQQLHVAFSFLANAGNLDRHAFGDSGEWHALLD